MMASGKGRVSFSKDVVPDRAQPHSSACSHDNDYMSSTNASKWVIIEKENKGKEGTVLERPWKEGRGWGRS